MKCILNLVKLFSIHIYIFLHQYVLLAQRTTFYTYRYNGEFEEFNISIFFIQNNYNLIFLYPAITKSMKFHIYDKNNHRFAKKKISRCFQLSGACLREGGGSATGRGRSVPASSAPLSIISGQQEQRSNLVTPFILTIDPFAMPTKYPRKEKEKKSIPRFNRELQRDLVENFRPTLFHKLFPTDNTTLDL